MYRSREPGAVEEDTEGNSATAIAKYRKLVDHDRIHVRAGILLVNVGNSIVPLIERDQLPTLFLTTPDDLTKRKIAKWILRSNFSASQMMHPLGDYAAKSAIEVTLIREAPSSLTSTATPPRRRGTTTAWTSPWAVSSTRPSPPVYSGILARHPRLRVCLATSGARCHSCVSAWCWAGRCGTRILRRVLWVAESPESYLERFWFDVISYFEPALLAGVPCVGADRLVIGSDAPFAMGSLARSIASIREFEFLPGRDRQRILGENAKAFLDGSA